MILINVLVAAFSLLMLLRHGPRALLYLAPGSIRISGDPHGAPRASGQVAAGEQLERLGFRRLGLRRERSLLGGLDMEVDAWAHPDGTCADAYPSGGRAVAVSFLTTFADGFQAGTSNFRRASIARPSGRVGGIEGAGLESALAAHRKAVEALTGHGAPRAVDDLDLRIELARAFYRGIGGAELRRPSLMSLLNASIAILLFASSVRLALRSLGLLP